MSWGSRTDGDKMVTSGMVDRVAPAPDAGGGRAKGEQRYGAVWAPRRRCTASMPRPTSYGRTDDSLQSNLRDSGGAIVHHHCRPQRQRRRVPRQVREQASLCAPTSAPTRCPMALIPHSTPGRPWARSAQLVSCIPPATRPGRSTALHAQSGAAAWWAGPGTCHRRGREARPP
jgi:hypothetical protein